ncbi:MAG: polyprenyl synthetase family protein [Candidatus Margulisbacteria bacterium]|nr:polyprenyl synthetase family protein [Candidatus Margulisiibacteriota bacterium]
MDNTSNLETYITNILPTIEEALLTSLPAKPNDARENLHNAMQYSVTAKAKRIRPILTLLSHRLFCDNPKKIMPLACAIELIHTYSLIHDDLPAMDNDDYRRGQLTCHKKYGEAIAILAGDTLNSFGFELLARELPKHFSPIACLKAIAKLGHALGLDGMSGGQTLDFLGTKTQQDLQYLESTHLKKTGALIQACLYLPALLEEKEEEVQTHLYQFGTHLGLLFQITDDILDVVGASKDLGKTGGKDQEQQKLTYVSLSGIEGARKLATHEAQKAKEILTQINYPTHLLSDMVIRIEMRTY